MKNFSANKCENANNSVEVFSADKYENANKVGIFIFIGREIFMLSYV